MLINLTQLKPGQKARIVQIQGGWKAASRLHNLGIREGKTLIKVSSHFWHGPQTITMGNTQISLGFGMADKLIVEAEKGKEKKIN